MLLRGWLFVRTGMLPIVQLVGLLVATRGGMMVVVVVAPVARGSCRGLAVFCLCCDTPWDVLC